MDINITALAAYGPLLPEITLVLALLIILMVGVFDRHEGPQQGLAWAGIAAMAIAAFFIIRQADASYSLFNGSFRIDRFSQFMKLLVLFGSAAALFMSFPYMRRVGLLRFEYVVLVLFAVTGMMMMISAGGLIALYLGLEMQSLALYVIAAYRRDSMRSGEAGLKYFVLGGLSSGLLLYGASLIYGFTGTTLFDGIANAVQTSGPGVGLIFGLVFLLAGLAFKISAVPFHMWTPDVYQGAPTPITAFFAAAPKIAAMALLARVVLGAFPAITTSWQQVIVFISIASMAWGAFAAIGQRNIKRLMAYSSIGHMGYALVGLASGSVEGTKGVMIYLTIYVIMTLGAFACILAMRRGDDMVEEIDELAGLAQNNLPMAFLLAMLLFSLAGIPPLAGFFAKFYVFLAAIDAGLYALAVLGVLASVVGAFYYLRIVKVMFFDEPQEAFEPMPGGLRFVLGVSGAFVLLYVVYPTPLVIAAETAARTFF